MPEIKQPIVTDDKNKVVYYAPEDITPELVAYWEAQPGMYAVAVHVGEQQ